MPTMSGNRVSARLTWLVALLFVVVAVGVSLGKYLSVAEVSAAPAATEQVLDATPPPAPYIHPYIVDEFHRLVAAPNKIEVVCPAPSESVGVLLVLGQSNAANFGEKRMTSVYPGKVVNYFSGKCYEAASPLLGAGGEEGEFLTPLADKLISDGVYKAVVIVATAIGSSSVSQWGTGGDLSPLLQLVLNDLRGKFKVSEVVWHQGEADYRNTTLAAYARSFRSLQADLRQAGVAAPIFISVASRCGPLSTWKARNPISKAQRSLVDGRRVLLAANTDFLINTADRRQDQCHFGAVGQEKAASAYAYAIKRHRRAF